MSCAEMIRSGTTCLNDMYYHPVETANVINRIGMRSVIGMMVHRDEESKQFVPFLFFFDSLESKSRFYFFFSS